MGGVDHGGLGRRDGARRLLRAHGGSLPACRLVAGRSGRRAAPPVRPPLPAAAAGPGPRGLHGPCRVHARARDCRPWRSWTASACRGRPDWSRVTIRGPWVRQDSDQPLSAIPSRTVLEVIPGGVARVFVPRFGNPTPFALSWNATPAEFCIAPRRCLSVDRSSGRVSIHNEVVGRITSVGNVSSPNASDLLGPPWRF